MIILHFLEFDGEAGGRQTHEVGCQQQKPNSNCLMFASHVKKVPAFSRKAIFLVSWLRAVEDGSVHLRLILKYLFVKFGFTRGEAELPIYINHDVFAFAEIEFEDGN